MNYEMPKYSISGCTQDKYQNFLSGWKAVDALIEEDILDDNYMVIFLDESIRTFLENPEWMDY